MGCLLSLLRDRKGTVAIETAFIAPILLTLGLGTFEVGNIVVRQHELQSAASEAESIALVAAQGATTSTTQIKSILKTSLGLSDDQVSITRLYRCDAEETLRTSPDPCKADGLLAAVGGTGTLEDQVLVSYVQIDLKDTYTPVWVDFGVGSPYNYAVTRMVQLS